MGGQGIVESRSSVVEGIEGNGRAISSKTMTGVVQVALMDVKVGLEL